MKLQSSSSDALQQVELLEGYLRDDPQNVGLVAEAAMAAIACGAYERAGFLLSNSCIPRDDLQMVHLRGLLALAQHRFADAADEFQRMIKRGVASASVRFNRAYALLRQGLSIEAATEFAAILDRSDAPIETLAYLLRALHHAGEMDHALMTWERSADHLKSTEAAGVAGLVYLDSGQDERARELAQRALQAPVPHKEALVTLATLAVKDGDFDRALTLLEPVLERSPDDGRISLVAGVAMLSKGQILEAATVLERAVQFLPGDAGSRIFLAWSKMGSRDFQRGRALLEEALAIDSNLSEVHGGLAVIAVLEGLRDDARQFVERAFRVDAKSPSAQFAVAVLEGQTVDAGAMWALARRMAVHQKLEGGVRSLSKLHGAQRRDV